MLKFIIGSFKKFNFEPSKKFRLLNTNLIFMAPKIIISVKILSIFLII